MVRHCWHNEALIMSIISGPRYLSKGWRLIWKPGVRRYAFWPLLINTLLFGTAIWAGAHYFSDFIDWLLPNWLDWLAWLLWPLFAVGIAIIVFYTFTLIANLIAGPFNGLLAEAVERELTGVSGGSDMTVWQMAQEIPASVANEARKLGYFAVRAIPLLILFLIPGINVLAPLLWILFSAWLLALEYMDYPMANHGYKFPQIRGIAAQKRTHSMSFGGSVLVMTMIPFVNFFAMPVAVAGATALYVERIKEEGPPAVPPPP